MPAKNRSLAVKSAPSAPRRSSVGIGSFRRREHSTGTTVTATNSDIASENITTTESWTNRMLEIAAQEEQRHEHGDVREDRREDCRPDLLAAFDGRLHAGLAQSPCGGRCSRARRSRRRRSCRRPSASPPNVIVFSVKPGEIEQRERADDRNRDREADDERRPEVAQEDEDDRDDQEARRGTRTRFTDAIDRSMYVDWSSEHGQVHARHFAVDALDLVAHGLGDRDGVLARTASRPAAARRACR